MKVHQHPIKMLLKSMANDCFIVSSLGVALCLYRMKVGCCLREIAIAAACSDAEHYVPFRILCRIHNNKRTLIIKEFVSWLHLWLYDNFRSYLITKPIDNYICDSFQSIYQFILVDNIPNNSPESVG
jgi:hypothetical protein